MVGSCGFIAQQVLMGWEVVESALAKIFIDVCIIHGSENWSWLVLDSLKNKFNLGLAIIVKCFGNNIYTSLLMLLI